jgi:hypothetical protein
LGALAEHARWIVADIADDRLELDEYRVWHDRAVCHFLTTMERHVGGCLNLDAAHPNFAFASLPVCH